MRRRRPAMLQRPVISYLDGSHIVMAFGLEATG
jgi:hypothetical protein